MIDPTRCFPFIVEPKPCGAIGHLSVPLDLPYFDGHFPGNPVLPAVAILDATECLIARAIGKPVALTAVPSAKFLGIVSPGLSVRIEITETAAGEWSARWVNAANESSLADLRVRVELRD